VTFPLLPAGTPGPDVQRNGRETTATVPVTGSTAAMSHHSLAGGRGLAVNLPRARAGLTPGLHRIGHDGLAFVWIRERGEGRGLHVRFIFTSPPPDERLLELDEDAVRIRIRLPAAPLGEAPVSPAPMTDPVASITDRPAADDSLGSPPPAPPSDLPAPDVSDLVPAADPGRAGATGAIASSPDDMRPD
jgi:hypothetical protein